jgi:hypothetical protein
LGNNLTAIVLILGAFPRWIYVMRSPRPATAGAFLRGLVKTIRNGFQNGFPWQGSQVCHLYRCLEPLFSLFFDQNAEEFVSERLADRPYARKIEDDSVRLLMVFENGTPEMRGAIATRDVTPD